MLKGAPPPAPAPRVAVATRGTPQLCVLRLASFPLRPPLFSLLRHGARFDSKKGDLCPSRFVHERLAASLLDAGCGIRIDEQSAVRAMAAFSAATCELDVRSRTRARAHSHRILVNKAQPTDASTAAARACRPGRVGVGYLLSDVEWERRHVAQVRCSHHRIIAESPAATTKERRATISGRALPCRLCSWAHGRRTTRGGSGT